MSRSDGCRARSTGLLLLAFLPVSSCALRTGMPLALARLVRCAHIADAHAPAASRPALASYVDSCRVRVLRSCATRYRYVTGTGALQGFQGGPLSDPIRRVAVTPRRARRMSGQVTAQVSSVNRQ